METFPPAWRPAGLQTPKQQSKYHASLVQWMASIIYDLIYPHQTWQYFPIASPNFLSLTVAQRRAEGEKEPKDRSGRSTWFNRQWGSNIYCTSPLVPLMVSTISYSTCLNLCFFFNQPTGADWPSEFVEGFGHLSFKEKYMIVHQKQRMNIAERKSDTECRPYPFVASKR